jgi:hypothetical protein
MSCQRMSVHFFCCRPSAVSQEFFYKYKTAHVVEQPELRLSFDPWTQKASFSVEFST